MVLLTPKLGLAKPQLGIGENIDMDVHFNNNWNILEDEVGQWASPDGLGLDTIDWTTTGTVPSIGNGNLQGFGIQLGHLKLVNLLLGFGSTTSPGTGLWRFSALTTRGGTAVEEPGLFTAFDNSANLFHTLVAYWIDTTTIAFFTEGGKEISNTVPFTWAVDDELCGTIIYEGP